jgi:hypothetical protein
MLCLVFYIGFISLTSEFIVEIVEYQDIINVAENFVELWIDSWVELLDVIFKLTFPVLTFGSVAG